MSSISNLTTTDAPLWESSHNHAPLVSVLAWFLIVTSFLSILARVATRYAVVRQLRWDDAFIILALVIDLERSRVRMSAKRICQFLSIAHTVTTSMEAANGLGKHSGAVPEQNLRPFQKVS